MRALICVSSVMMMLAGCSPSNDGALTPVPTPRPPAPPAELVEACPDPGVRAGASALSELVRNRQALAVCRDRHGRLVAYVADITGDRP